MNRPAKKVKPLTDLVAAHPMDYWNPYSDYNNPKKSRTKMKPLKELSRLAKLELAAGLDAPGRYNSFVNICGAWSGSLSLFLRLADEGLDYDESRDTIVGLVKALWKTWSKDQQNQFLLTLFLLTLCKLFYESNGEECTWWDVQVMACLFAEPEQMLDACLVAAGKATL